MGILIDATAIPEAVNVLFFSLSAWNSPNIAAYGRPDVRILNSETDDVLASYQIARAGDQQAVVMCAMFRNAHGHWAVIEVEEFCRGNARAYGGIWQACQHVAQTTPGFPWNQ